MPVGLMRVMVNQKNVRQPGKVSMIFFWFYVTIVLYWGCKNPVKYGPIYKGRLQKDPALLELRYEEIKIWSGKFVNTL